jgi:hypothetical protein
MRKTVDMILTNSKYTAQYGLTITTITLGHRYAHRNKEENFSRLPDNLSVRPERKAILLKNGRCDVINRKRDYRYRSLFFHSY